MTESEAIEWVYNQDENNGPLDVDELESCFEALFNRVPCDEDRQNGLWSLCCSATPNCGTRPEN